MLRRLSHTALRRQSKCPYHYQYQNSSGASTARNTCSWLPLHHDTTAVAVLSSTAWLWQSSPLFHHTKRFHGAYVSRHNVSLNVSPQIITEYCQSHGLQLKSNGSHVMIRECPFCTKPTKGQLSNLYKLYIESNTGAYFCHRCGAAGSWYDLKAKLNGGYYTPAGTSAGAGMGSTSRHPHPYPHSRSDGHASAASGTTMDHGTTDGPLPLPPSRLAGIYSTRLLDLHQDGPEQHQDNSSNNTSSNTNSSNNSNPALDYLVKQRGLSRATLRKFGVGRAIYKFPSDNNGYVETECITFPWFIKESELQQQEAMRTQDPSKMMMKNFRPPPTDTTSTSRHSSASSSTTPNTNTNAPEEASDKDQAPIQTDPYITRRIKARAIAQKGWQRLDPVGGGWGLFGWHTIPDDATEIVITEGEYDAMAVSQATGRHVVSLPNGCRSLPVPILPLLERFTKIYLWMDNDLPGQEGSEKFAKKLGLNRCFVVQCRDAKDANEALLKGLDLESYIQQATVVPHDRLLTFADLRSEVLHELLEPDLYKGAEITSLPLFTKLIKGFRRGELTVLTGPTGSGKTTFLGQISLDLAEQGMNVLWGSFEIKNTRLLHKLMKQYSRDALPDPKQPDAKEKLNALADRFESLPMQFLRFHGGSDIDEVLDAMEYAVYVHDTEHIILDNMQFMISRGNMSKNGGSWEKFDVQDMAIEKFRKFATQQNVHLTLVVHPRKEDEAAKLNISSFYGSAKATQEADTVLILQHDGRRKYVEVKKNRFDGTLGHSPLFFESKSGRYVETEGGSGGGNRTNNNNKAQSSGDQPESISFPPPRNEQPPWMKQQRQRQEPEIDSKNVDNFWDDMLTTKPPKE